MARNSSNKKMRAPNLKSLISAPWDKAPEAFEMYAECAKDSLKLTLEV